jgi:hypothetical protein
MGRDGDETKKNKWSIFLKRRVLSFLKSTSPAPIWVPFPVPFPPPNKRTFLSGGYLIDLLSHVTLVSHALLQGGLLYVLDNVL